MGMQENGRMNGFRYFTLVLAFLSSTGGLLAQSENGTKPSYGLSVFRQTSVMRPYEYDISFPFYNKEKLSGTTETHYPFLFWYEFSNRLRLEFTASKFQITDGHYKTVGIFPAGVFEWTTGINTIDRSQETLQLLRSYNVFGMRLSPGIGLRHQRRQVSFRSASSVVHEDMNALMLQGALRLEIPLPASFSLQLDGAGYIGEGRFRPAPLADISSDWQYAWVRLSDERTGQASGYEWNAAFHYALNENVSLSLGYGVTQDYRHLWNDPFVSLYFSANNPPAVYLYDQYAFATGMLRERISSYSLGLHVRL